MIIVRVGAGNGEFSGFESPFRPYSGCLSDRERARCLTVARKSGPSSNTDSFRTGVSIFALVVSLRDTGAYWLFSQFGLIAYRIYSTL